MLAFRFSQVEYVGDMCGGPVSGKVYSTYVSDLISGSILRSESVSMKLAT